MGNMQYLGVESSLWRYLNGSATLVLVQSMKTEEYKDELHIVVAHEVLFMATSWLLPLGG